MNRASVSSAVLLSCWFATGSAIAAPPAGSLADPSGATAGRAITIEQAVAEALAHHPRIKTASNNEDAADSRVDEARTRELPQVGISAQINRSTGNTVPGAFFSAVGFPPIAGPTRGKDFDSGVWQTGVSLWANWDLLSLARQAAAVDVALAARSEASATVSAQRLEIAYHAADTFLLLLEAQQAVRAAQTNVERARTVDNVTKTLVEKDLRPGADAARADAELAAAQMQLIRAEQAREIRRAELAEAMGNTAEHVEATPGSLLAPNAPTAAGPSTPSPSHPDIVRSEAVVRKAAESEAAVRVEYLPRLDLAAALWVRGSGLFDSPASGLGPDIPNWAAGAILTWPLLDVPTIRARARAASATRAAAESSRDDAYLAIAGQLSRAQATLDGTERIAQQTDTTLAAAKAAEEQAVSRYQTGLSPVTEVADAERLLAQAELEGAVARLEIQRALLLLARAAGDLEPFFARLRKG
jgi:outer membrane protein TolC